MKLNKVIDKIELNIKSLFLLKKFDSNLSGPLLEIEDVAAQHCF